MGITTIFQFSFEPSITSAHIIQVFLQLFTGCSLSYTFDLAELNRNAVICYYEQLRIEVQYGSDDEDNNVDNQE